MSRKQIVLLVLGFITFGGLITEAYLGVKMGLHYHFLRVTNSVLLVLFLGYFFIISFSKKKVRPRKYHRFG